MKEKLKNIKKEQVMLVLIGLLLGILIMLIFYPERIAKLKNSEERVAKVSEGEITANDIYEELKDKYASSVLLDLIDSAILNDKYKELTKEEQEELNTNIENYIKQYSEYYSLSEDDVIKKIGFESKTEFTTYMELDYKRNKYFKNYVANNLTDEEIQDYYDNNVFADSNIEHILVKVGTLSETDAQEKAQEILDKLNDGASWIEVKAEYADIITNEEFNISFDSNIEANFLKGVYGLEEGTYSKQLIRTSYGYHIIYRKEIIKEKESLKELKTRIKDVLVNKKRSEDSKLYERVMIEMRKDSKLKISDTKLEKSYKEYIKSYEE